MLYTNIDAKILNKILANSAIHNHSKEIKFYGVNLTKHVHAKINNDEREQRFKWMRKHSVFMAWNIQYGKVVDSAQVDI